MMIIHIFHSTIQYRLHYNSIKIMADQKVAITLGLALMLTLALVHM